MPPAETCSFFHLIQMGKGSQATRITRHGNRLPCAVRLISLEDKQVGLGSSRHMPDYRQGFAVSGDADLLRINDPVAELVSEHNGGCVYALRRGDHLDGRIWVWMVFPVEFDASFPFSGKSKGKPVSFEGLHLDTVLGFNLLARAHPVGIEARTPAFSLVGVDDVVCGLAVIAIFGVVVVKIVSIFRERPDS